jgi:hypothetical protein
VMGDDFYNGYKVHSRYGLSLYFGSLHFQKSIKL